jgi:hypothetical protein
MTILAGRVNGASCHEVNTIDEKGKTEVSCAELRGLRRSGCSVPCINVQAAVCQWRMEVDGLRGEDVTPDETTRPHGLELRRVGVSTVAGSEWTQPSENY